MKATFAGGCFWCMVPPFAETKGVIKIVSGYSEREEGESEAVQLEFNGKEVSYKELVEIFWRHIDPTDEGGQFYDRGVHYLTAIFYHDNKQKKIAEESKKELQKHFEEKIVTDILPFKKFREAEDYHQDFYKKHPFQYNAFKLASGRKSYLERVWGKK